MMGGSLEIDSEPGVGSTFHFRARFRTSDQPRQHTSGSPPPPRTGKLRLLLAEDNVINQKVAVGMLEAAGHEITVVNNGQEAVAALEQQPVDAILMDVQMPEMDGLQATAMIREREKTTGRHTPIIALTAHAMKGDQERCLAAGMDDYVSKPIRPEELLARSATALECRPRTRVERRRMGAPTRTRWTRRRCWSASGVTLTCWSRS